MASQSIEELRSLDPVSAGAVDALEERNGAAWEVLDFGENGTVNGGRFINLSPFTQEDDQCHDALSQHARIAEHVSGGASGRNPGAVMPGSRSVLRMVVYAAACESGDLLKRPAAGAGRGGIALRSGRGGRRRRRHHLLAGVNKTIQWFSRRPRMFRR